MWEFQLRENPFEATTLGDPRYHGNVPDVSLGGRDTARRELSDLLGRARFIDPDELDDTDAATSRLASRACGDLPCRRLVSNPPARTNSDREKF